MLQNTNLTYKIVIWSKHRRKLKKNLANLFLPVNFQWWLSRKMNWPKNRSVKSGLNLHFRKKFCKTCFVNAKNAHESSLKSSNSDEFKELNIFLYLGEKIRLYRASNNDLVTFSSDLVKNRGFCAGISIFYKKLTEMNSTTKRIAKKLTESKKEPPLFIAF